MRSSVKHGTFRSGSLAKGDNRAAVIFLNRDLASEGLLDRFLASYFRFKPRMAHDLYILQKGATPISARTTKITQGKTWIKFLNVPDEGFDIGSYLYAAKNIAADYFVFFNSSAKILRKNWLEYLSMYILDNSAGMVSATGSWESFWTNIYYLEPTFRISGWPTFPTGLKDFPPFPNPHLRTNAFCIKRELFLNLEITVPKEKIDCWLLESGENSISRQIAKRGYELLVVDKFGNAYKPYLWNAAKTFRSGEQEHLLISDNQTEYFISADPNRREFLSLGAWMGPFTESKIGKRYIETNHVPISFRFIYFLLFYAPLVFKIIQKIWRLAIKIKSNLYAPKQAV